MKIKFFLPVLLVILLGSGCVPSVRKPNQPLSTASDGRIILISGNYDDKPELCQASFNAEPANATVLYSSKERGISLQVPFNEKWGNEQYVISPYYEIPGEDTPSLQFGNIRGGFGEGHCGLGRDFEMYSSHQQTAESIINNLKTATMVKYKDIVRKEINGLTVITYQTENKPENNFCDQKVRVDAQLIIIGKKFNYGFLLPCESSIQVIEDILQSAKLVE